MSPIMSLLLLQVVAPLIPIVGNAVVRPASWWALAARTMLLTVVVAWSAVAGLWLYPPSWTPYLLAGVAVISVVIAAIRLRRKGSSDRRWWRATEAGVVLVVAVVAAALLLPGPVRGRSLPGPAVDLAAPLPAGDYYVASGGSTRAVNAHLATLDGELAEKWRGQSYAVDVVKVDGWGRRAHGIAPADPARYFIFGQPVLAPCAGEVRGVRADLVDQRVPDTDRDNLPGNHVLLACGDHEVLLAHLRGHSVVVAKGAQVRVGDKLGEVGNTGNTSEPHLHIHAQRPSAEPERPLAGAPQWITIDGTFPIRNRPLNLR